MQDKVACPLFEPVARYHFYLEPFSDGFDKPVVATAEHSIEDLWSGLGYTELTVFAWRSHIISCSR